MTSANVVRNPKVVIIILGEEKVVGKIDKCALIVVLKFGSRIDVIWICLIILVYIYIYTCIDSCWKSICIILLYISPNLKNERKLVATRYTLCLACSYSIF